MICAIPYFLLNSLECEILGFILNDWNKVNFVITAVVIVSRRL